MKKPFIRFFVLFVFLFQACAAPPSSTAVTPLPSSTPTPLPTDTPTSILATSVPSSPRPNYTLKTTIDYDRHFVAVDETIIYPNQTGVPLDSLTLSIAANLWQNCFKLKSALIDGTPVTDVTLNGHRLDIPLPTTLEPASVSTVRLVYNLSLPFMDQVHSLRARIFGYSNLQMNLTNWYPFVVPFKDDDWLIHEPWSHGEYLVYPLADFDVTIQFTDPAHAPVLATSGVRELGGEITHYTLTAGRAFAISASQDFEVTSLKVGDLKISSYYFPIYKRAGEGALIVSKQAIEVYSQLFGPYPHQNLSIVVADFMDSMEFSALYFHSRYFYDQFDGSAQNYLTFVAAHETAHQWWFEQVANDQALEPWLDEALCTYSEALFYEMRYPDLVPWWWSYRIDFFKPSGYIDIPVYQGQNDDNYKHTVYFNGAHFLHDLRERIGNEAFFTFLGDYFMQSRGKIVTRDDFFRILDEHTSVDYSSVVRQYFRK